MQPENAGEAEEEEALHLLCNTIDLFKKEEHNYLKTSKLKGKKDAILSRKKQ